MKRVCVYPKDVSVLTGKSLRNAQKILQDLKFILKKEKNKFITIEEFATYSGIEAAKIETIWRMNSYDTSSTVVITDTSSV